MESLWIYKGIYHPFYTKRLPLLVWTIIVLIAMELVLFLSDKLLG
ncbi:hypothetical protein Desru_0009 [Desulforamulus ruminis DSM 2154]|uniref:Uncharacterized protein n=1 Tax=Desulforamulus ruminis (strain ATCC 23193 / DSM 2154 / NCIMB 8452 / DL) TaxID=696281 RepID=F6DL07_DESRL|nr:hypothetical protein Desru_0009 [Desulforamulus ruminis DSM 2154]